MYLLYFFLGILSFPPTSYRVWRKVWRISCCRTAPLIFLPRSKCCILWRCSVSLMINSLFLLLPEDGEFNLLFLLIAIFPDKSWCASTVMSGFMYIHIFCLSAFFSHPSIFDHSGICFFLPAKCSAYLSHLIFRTVFGASSRCRYW